MHSLEHFELLLSAAESEDKRKYWKLDVYNKLVKCHGLVDLLRQLNKVGNSTSVPNSEESFPDLWDTIKYYVGRVESCRITKQLESINSPRKFIHRYSRRNIFGTCRIRFSKVTAVVFSSSNFDLFSSDIFLRGLLRFLE